MVPTYRHCMSNVDFNWDVYLQTRKQLDLSEPGKILGGLDSLMEQVRNSQLNDSGNEEKASIAKLFEQGSCLFLCLLLFSFNNNFNACIYFLVLNNKVIHIAVGLQKILSLLEAEDADVRIHAVKVVANLAAEGEFMLAYPFHHQLFLNFC